MGEGVSGVAIGAFVVPVAGRRSSAALRLRLRKSGAFARAFARGAAAAAEATAAAAAEAEEGLPLEGAFFCPSSPRSWFWARLSSRDKLSSPVPRRRREERACLVGRERGEGE